MAPGSYTVPLRIDAPYSIWDTVKTVAEAGGGHIVITPQRLDPRLVGDTSMLAAARYAGPVLSKTFTDGAFRVGGAGMGWWLGDDTAGPVYETAVTLTGANLSTALTALLPAAVTLGTVTATGNLFTGTFHYETPRDAIATLMATTEAEYRINPDGTMDAAVNQDLFTIVTPTVVVTRFGSGSDPNFAGVPVATLKSVDDAYSYATRALLVTVAADGSASTDASANQAPVATGKDINGNTIVRTLVYNSGPGGASTPGLYLASELGEHLLTTESTLTTGFWELAGGGWNVGDAFWVYDDPAFVDTANQVQFRGDVIHPRKMRLIGASWPLVDGMGVAFRDDAGVYTDLTDWIRWEAQDQTAGFGTTGTDIAGGVGGGGGSTVQGASTLTVRSMVARAAGC